MNLKSYVVGKWVEGKGELAKLVNPTTEQVIAETGTGGVDFAAALDHARTTGGPALRAKSFAERGKMIMAVSSAIHEHREELVDLAIANGGNTRGDAKFDLDGATGTLAYYASLGESLGDAPAIIDGEMTQLGRSPRLVGQHVRLPLTGAAVHINAFNFPAWGFGEKAACAWLAGMPVITKPATSTAVVAARIAEIVVASGAVPEGAFQFLSGSAGDLFDHLTSQDVVAFTGSSHTGVKLRGHRNVIAHSIRVNVEADSLNAAVLGNDVEHGSDTYEMFIREVARDMTQKTGQKCTAIRRVFVPSTLAVNVRDDLADRLRETKVGNPALSEVKMGPLATAQQHSDVRAGVARLAASLEFVLGDGGRGTLTGVDGDKGYFIAPVLFVARSVDAADVHAHEVFGPVATILPYRGNATDAIRRGGGGLVASVYTDDIDIAREFVFGSGPFHGRLTIGGEKVAEHSMGPGTVLPQMLHGGPGRAGGGEELGGTRGMGLYQQRVAIQAYRPLLEKILGIHG